MENYIALFFMAVLWVLAYITILQGKKGKALKLRNIPIWDYVQEAVGRAAEMGRSVFFTSGHGGGGLSGQQAGAHLAGLSVFSYVVQECAKNDIPCYFVPSFPELVVQAENIMREAGQIAGKPEYFKPEFIQFYSTSDHPWILGCVHTIRQENTIANFMIGSWWSSEMLIIGGAGRARGCMQIGGQVDPAGIASAMVVCDYVMMGEEVYAAGAFLSKDIPKLNSIVSGDYTKYIWIALMVIGVILSSLGVNMKWITM